jgi:ribosomal-protein-alanine N-acetyltransferase
LTLNETDRVAPGFEITRAGWRDLNELHALEHDCFENEAWSLLDLVGVLTLPSISRLKVVVEGKMVGFASGDVRKNEMLGWINTIGIAKTYRRRGLGRALLRASEADMKMPRVCLCVRKSNQPAITMYNSEGYHSIDLWRRYYEDGEDAIVMEKQRRKGELQRLSALKESPDE